MFMSQDTWRHILTKKRYGLIDRLIDCLSYTNWSPRSLSSRGHNMGAPFRRYNKAGTFAEWHLSKRQESRNREQTRFDWKNGKHSKIYMLRKNASWKWPVSSDEVRSHGLPRLHGLVSHSSPENIRWRIRAEPAWLLHAHHAPRMCRKCISFRGNMYADLRIHPVCFSIEEGKLALWRILCLLVLHICCICLWWCPNIFIICFRFRELYIFTCGLFTFFSTGGYHQYHSFGQGLSRSWCHPPQAQRKTTLALDFYGRYQTLLKAKVEKMKGRLFSKQVNLANQVKKFCE